MKTAKQIVAIIKRDIEEKKAQHKEAREKGLDDTRKYYAAQVNALECVLQAAITR